MNMINRFVFFVIHPKKFMGVVLAHVAPLIKDDAQFIKIENDKDKANFGNICVMLRGYRMIADASEAMLINENVLKGNDGFYQKIEDEENPKDEPEKKEE